MRVPAAPEQRHLRGLPEPVLGPWHPVRLTVSAGAAAPFRLSTCAGERKDQLEARPELASGRLQTSALIRKSQTRRGADKQTPTSRWSQIRATSALGAPFLLNCPVSCQLFSFLLRSPLPPPKKKLPGQLHCRIFAFGLCSFMLPRGPLPFREPQFPSLADGGRKWTVWFHLRRPEWGGIHWWTNQGELVSSRAFVHASGLLGHHVPRLISKHIHLFLM